MHNNTILLDEQKPVPPCVPKVRVHPRGGADRDPAPRPEGATVAEVPGGQERSRKP